MQRIAVIGGTGMTGQCVVDYALNKGLKVNLLYRTEETVPERFKDHVEMVKGNATNLDDCKKVVKGVDGVCIILGTRNKLEATTELSTGTKNVVQAMKELGVRPLSVVMSSFLFRKVEEVPAMFHNLNEEHARMLEITKSSDLEYVAILPPHIADEPASEYILKENEAPGRAVSKHDLAKFIVDSLADQQYYRKVWGIAKKPQ